MPTLRWLTRDQDVRAAEKVPYRLLEEVPELGYGDRDTGNMLIQGDNLQALKSLLPFYAGQVKCIYIDPPYNTQSAVSIHYDDNLEHAQWMGIMWPRLELLREFLTLDGYIAVQIDDNQFARLYVVMSEIFGENQLKTIVVKMSEASGLKMGSVKRSGTIPKIKEYIIIAKMNGVRGMYLDRVPKGQWDNEYNILLEKFLSEDKILIDKIGEQDEISEIDIQELDKIAERIVLGSVAAEIKRLGLSGKEKDKWLFENAYRICQCATSTSVLRLAEEKKQYCPLPQFFVRNGGGNILYFVRATYSMESSKPRVQLIFAEDNLTVHPGDLWTDIKTTGLDGEGGVDFKNGKKPEQVVARVISMATNPGDLVMDSFLGSGTTAAVAQKMNRRFIGIEMGDHAVTHCQPRLQKVVDGEQGGISSAQNWQGGGGFRFFKLGAAVFDETGGLQPDIRFPTLAAHIWFSETNQPWNPPESATPFLGALGGRGIALLYNGILGDKSVNGGNVLNRQTLRVIREVAGKFEGPITVYGERTVLSDASLEVESISFKQTPYDVRARK
jgi:adenine-specific DNA-methyltransferase